MFWYFKMLSKGSLQKIYYFICRLYRVNLEKVQQLHLVAVIVNVSGKWIHFIVLWTEKCFSEPWFQTFQVLQGSQELVEMSSASREWWSMIQSLSSDPSAAENRGSVTLNYFFIHGLILKHYKHHWACIIDSVGESGYSSLQDGLTYEDIQVGF